MKNRDITRLRDTLVAATRIQRWIDGRDRASLDHDDLLLSAIERQFEIIGESLRVVRSRHPAIEQDLPEIHGWVALRNIVAHQYQYVDHDVVWTACTQELPLLIGRLESILE